MQKAIPEMVVAARVSIVGTMWRSLCVPIAAVLLAVPDAGAQIAATLAQAGDTSTVVVPARSGALLPAPRSSQSIPQRD